MKKNIIIIIAAVIVAAGIGTGVFFGARSSKTEPTSEAASTVEAATTTTQNIDKTDAVTEETTELTTEATTTKSSSKSSEKLLKADTGDFENLTHILNYTKKLYANGSSWTFDDSWVRKDAKSESYTFYAVWEYAPTKAPKLDKESISIRYKSGDTISVTNGVTVTWASSNSSVAIVDDNGNITAKKKGNATIIATSADGSTAECQVNVYMEWWQTLLKIISFGIY